MERTLKDEKLEYHFREILRLLGQNTDREGLKDTPKRYIKSLKNFIAPEHFEFTTFDSEGMDQMVIVKDIQFYSLCEHHIAPFFGTACVAYIPNGRVVGLSKLARVVDYYSHALQNQERITSLVADRLQAELKPKGVAVLLRAQHLCMSMRGVKKHTATTTTSKLTGVFMEGEARKEFLQLAI